MNANLWATALADLWAPICAVALTLTVVLSLLYVLRKHSRDDGKTDPGCLQSFGLFFYASFIKPHTGDDGGQQNALESFYKSQATVYDATRKQLLRGREDMLGLVAAQLKYRLWAKGSQRRKPIWVDIGGGTGYNIEMMSAYVSVPDYFKTVYLVDLSPSLCEIARQRFSRLGWKNVKIICQDARSFRIEDHEAAELSPEALSSKRRSSYPMDYRSERMVADLVTMSYALSMIPEFYSVIDSLGSLLAPNGVMGVVDFYVQSVVDVASRNYTGGVFNRHVNWLGRVFWRAWFEVDRVGLEAARRDYLEYRCGTILSVDERNYLLGGIPYYIWIGCQKQLTSSVADVTSQSQDIIRRLDAAATESPYLLPVNDTRTDSAIDEQSDLPDVRSKAYESAIVNLISDLPLPAFFYQNHHWRIHYEDHQKKYTQFNNEYIYAFTWEDVLADKRLLKIGADDVILSITSAGDNILSYALENPKRIHAVDLNPAQNHLLELKVACFTALDHADVWKIFGQGRHPEFRDILVSKLSAHMSSRAFQYWIDHTSVFTSVRGCGLYETGGSRHAIKLVKWLFRCSGLSSDVERLCRAKTLNEQAEIWHGRIRKVLLNRVLNKAVISTDKFLWKALGVPLTQRQMIEADYRERTRVSPTTAGGDGRLAIWEYMVNTLDPVVENTLIGEDNHFYLLCLQGRYSERCRPCYLTPKAHAKLSRADAFDGLRIHTDELNEVITRIMPGTLTIAVIMDSMDWFKIGSPEAVQQIRTLNYALKAGGRVLLRSAGLKPWYVTLFEELAFSVRRVSTRVPGACIDRVNMYASTWICTKTQALPLSPSPTGREMMKKKNLGNRPDTPELLEI